MYITTRVSCHRFVHQNNSWTKPRKIAKRCHIAVSLNYPLSPVKLKSTEWQFLQISSLPFDHVSCTNRIAAPIVPDVAGISNGDGSKLGVFTTWDEALFMDKSKNITFAMMRNIYSDGQNILLLLSSMSLLESNGAWI